MDADLQTHIAFYLTGKRQSSNLLAVDGLELHPALFAGYRDLSRLRHDFPLVLVADGVESLSGLIDAILDKIAHGDDGDRIRKHVLRLEQEIRTRVVNGDRGLFSALWDEAAPALIKESKLFADSLARARANLKIDGELIDCQASMPYHLLGHSWALTQKQRAKKFSLDLGRLVLKLSDILKADFANSDAGKSAENLKASFGTGPDDNFDFEAMSRILRKSSPKKNLSKNRRSRVQNLLAVLQAQKFFPTATAQAPTPYAFAFDSCRGALKAYRERLPKAIELAKALAMAELEIKGEYSEATHDALFASFGDNGLDSRELALLPDYLVRVNAASLTGAEQNELNEILAIDLPIKILVQTDDVIEESPLGNGHLAFAQRSRQLASMALGLNTVFVLQSPASGLYQMRQAIQSGLDYSGPALFSVFSGATTFSGGLSPYLIAAAALESRAFPAFTFDPSAGSTWASRFSLGQNPQNELDWPLHQFAYEDEKNQAVAEQIPFTLIDFVACDTRYSKHFALVPRAHWDATLSPVAPVVEQVGRGSLASVPCLLMVDAQNKLQKLIVDEKLIREARRCRSTWNSLQELAGINNSHAELRLAKERKIWEASAQAAKPAESVQPASAVAPVASAETQAPAAAEPEQEAQRSPDEAYIETPRCSTCNECTQINNKMFAYDGNQQAYIADLTAGTYAQLVEAAEGCQVSIIHPGKPRDPSEPGLDELLKRAELFI
jgi:hypothetical protein